MQQNECGRGWNQLAGGILPLLSPFSSPAYVILSERTPPSRKDVSNYTKFAGHSGNDGKKIALNTANIRTMTFPQRQTDLLFSLVMQINKKRIHTISAHKPPSQNNWLKACRKVMADSATIWVCGTFHNIFAVADILSELNFKMLNAVTWQKTNPPPNLSCRYFTHSTKLLVWARKEKRIPHYYNYDLMHKIADNRQMTDVWRMPAIAPWEKTCGKHPTQKPLALVVRAILASTKEHDRILDPFAGSGTTGIAARLTNRSFTGIDIEAKYLSVAAQRHELLPKMRRVWASKIPDLKMLDLA